MQVLPVQVYRDLVPQVFVQQGHDLFFVDLQGLFGFPVELEVLVNVADEIARDLFLDQELVNVSHLLSVLRGEDVVASDDVADVVDDVGVNSR